MCEGLKPYIEVIDYSKYNLVEPVIKPTAMTHDQLMQQLFDEYSSASQPNEIQNSSILDFADNQQPIKAKSQILIKT